MQAWLTIRRMALCPDSYDVCCFELVHMSKLEMCWVVDLFAALGWTLISGGALPWMIGVFSALLCLFCLSPLSFLDYIGTLSQMQNLLMSSCSTLKLPCTTCKTTTWNFFYHKWTIYISLVNTNLFIDIALDFPHAGFSNAQRQHPLQHELTRWLGLSI